MVYRAGILVRSANSWAKSASETERFEQSDESGLPRGKQGSTDVSPRPWLFLMELFGVLLCAYMASAAVYHFILPDLPVTKFDYPGFVKRNYTREELKACQEKMGQYFDGKFVGTPSNYNISQILKVLGGAPNEVEAPRRNEVTDLTIEEEDPSIRPLQDTPQDKWLYDYRATDYQYYYRMEHATKRFAGTDKEFLDIRGELAWTPEDFCGRARKAAYRQDDTGFSSEIKTDSCIFRDDKTFSCFSVTYCNSQPDGQLICIG